MKPNRQTLRNLAFLALLAAGCETAPPGAGITNGEPGPLRSEEKPAMRSDLPTPKNMSTGDTSLAAPAADNAVETDANPNQAVVPPPASADSPAPRSTPPTKEIPVGAQGATKPTETIETGTPRSPQ
jgi:hypothetical protein